MKMKKENKNYPATIKAVLFAILATIIILAITLPLTAYFAIKNVEKNVEQTGGPMVQASAQCDFSTPWYDQYSIITHALGSVEGRIHTNAKEAFIESYERGARVFEADFFLTSDGELVVRHDFTSTSYYNLEQKDIGHMTYEQYMDSVICYYYTPLDVKGLFELMKQYPDTYLVTDTKLDDEEGAKKTFEKFCEALDEAGDETLRDRIVIQIYNYDMYEWVKDIVPAKNYIFTLYMLKYKDFDKIGSFCAENNIPVVTLNETILKKETVDKLHGYGVEVFAHTLNRLAEMAPRYLDTGVDGYYSDYVTDRQFMGAVEIEASRREQGSGEN